MITTGYGACLIISIVLLLYMAQKNYENVDIYYWSIIVLVPLIILSYWLNSRITTVEGIKLTYCYIYLDSTVLLTLIIFGMLRLMEIKTSHLVKGLAYGAAFVHMLVVWLCVDNNFYYKEITIEETANGYASRMTDGPLKKFHYIYLLCILIAIVSIIIAAYVKKGNYSKTMLMVYTILVIIGLAIYLYETLTKADFTALPYLYTVVELILVFSYDNAHIHDISIITSKRNEANDLKGYISIDLKGRYLNSNAKAKEYMPFLKDIKVDSRLKDNNMVPVKIKRLIRNFTHNIKDVVEYELNGRVLACEITNFSMRKNGKPQGYLLELRDITEEKKNLELLSNYNDTLNRAVAEKTENIRNIQQNVVLGMANMIENRDNNTGGHVKRTSDIIKIIVDEIQKEDKINIDREFAKDIVRAAPMHDLGKLHIDSNILCKPARLTDEEYAIMKTHSTKSGEIVKILLEGVEEDHFVQTAFNVARYHHERWDGRGYPDGLVGTMIPLEARIMAVADVYDALVSKRCYKEPMSFDKAAEIMCEGMGTQFDPNMKRVFLGCREKLEEYYSKDREQES